MKKKYYGNLDIKNIAHNKKFWKTVQPLFSDKSTIYKSINIKTLTLVEDQRLKTNIKNNWKWKCPKKASQERKTLLIRFRDLIKKKKASQDIDIFAWGHSFSTYGIFFRKTNISYPDTRTCAYQGVEMLVFRKIMRTY